MPAKKAITVLRFLIILLVFSVAGVGMLNVWGGKSVKADLVETAVFDSDFKNGWINWSWGSDNSIEGGRFKFAPFSWGGLYLHNENPVEVSKYEYLLLKLNPTGPEAKFKLLFFDTNNQVHGSQLELQNFGGDLVVGQSKEYKIPTNQIPLQWIKGFAIQESQGRNLQVVYLEKAAFVGQNWSVPTPTVTPVPTNTIITPTLIPVPPSQGTGAVVNSNILAIFKDGLGSGWEDWSWWSNVRFENGMIGFTTNSAWAGMYLHSNQVVNTSPYKYLSLRIKASAADQRYVVGVYDEGDRLISGAVQLERYGGELVAGEWKTYRIPLGDLNATNRAIRGVALQESLGRIQPTIYISNLVLEGETAGQNTGEVLPINVSVPVVPTQQSNSSPSGSGYSVSGGKVYKNGNQIVLRGVNWFGFETTTYAPHGLWSRNWKEMIGQMKSVGFNAVRLPICSGSLKSYGVTGVDYDKNPDLRGLNSLQLLDKVMHELSNQQMFILVDYHRPDCNAISELWYEGGVSEEAWIGELKQVAERYKGLEYFMGVDLRNEPHGRATWGSGDVSTDWNLAAERAGKQVLASNSNVLIFVEGIGWNNKGNCFSGIAPFWGENLEGQKCAPISTQAIPANKLVLSPHVYGPDVNHQSYFDAGDFPNNMPGIWNTHFGFLTDSGFTLVVGEWGGKMGNNGGSQKDVILQRKLVEYFKSKGMCSSFYWSWNPNSGDTGGILQDDWHSVWQNKVDLLKDYYNGCR